MINSGEDLTLSLQFFLTVVNFSGETDDTSLLSSVGVSLDFFVMDYTVLQ